MANLPVGNKAADIFHTEVDDRKHKGSKGQVSEKQASALASQHANNLGMYWSRDWNRTTDLRFTKQARSFLETLGVSNGFPVLTDKTGTCVRSIDSMASRCIGGF